MWKERRLSAKLNAHFTFVMMDSAVCFSDLGNQWKPASSWKAEDAFEKISALNDTMLKCKAAKEGRYFICQALCVLWLQFYTLTGKCTFLLYSSAASRQLSGCQVVKNL